MENKSGIYQIQNLVNGKVYIGSTTNFVARKYQHLRALRANNLKNKKLQNAFNKYGEQNFEFSVIEYIENINNLIKYEQYYIDTYDCVKNGYNVRQKAETNRGCKFGPLSDERKLIISTANKGKKRKPLTKETLCKMSKAQTGRKHSEETKLKISKSNQGKIHSEETKHKIGVSSKGRIKSPETCKKLSEIARGRKNHFFGKNHNAETKQKLREAAILQWQIIKETRLQGERNNESRKNT